MKEYFFSDDIFYDEVGRLNTTASLTLKRIKNYELLFSYDTPVMIKIRGKWYEDERFYSMTTSKHKGAFKRDRGITPKKLHTRKFWEKMNKLIHPKLTENFDRKMSRL